MTTSIHDPANETVIDTVYAFMSIDDEGRNGIVAYLMPGLGTTPLVTGKPTVVEAMKPLAEKVALATSKRVGLFAFSRMSGPIWEAAP